MELEFLHCFETVARLQSITLASDELNLSPSAISSGLRKLEAELNCSLFERTPRGVVLTQNGEYFRKWANKNSGFLSQLQKDLRVTATKQGTLRIGTAIESDTLFILLSYFQKNHPNVKVEVLGERFLLENYLMSDLDAFVVSENDKRDLPGVFLAQRKTIFVLMRDEHPLSNRQSLSLDDLKGQRFVFSEHNGELEWTFDFCCEHGFVPDVQFLCEDYDGRLDVVAHSDILAIGYNTMRLLRESMRGIKAIPLETGEEMNKRFFLVWRKEHLNPLVELLIKDALEFTEKGRDYFLNK